MTIHVNCHLRMFQGTISMAYQNIFLEVDMASSFIQHDKG